MSDEPTLDRRTAELGSARLGPLMVKLSIPGMVGMLVMSLYNIVDTFWVSGLPNGTSAIAALTVLFPVQMIAGAFAWGTAAGVTSLVARRFGATRLDEANRAAGNAVSLSLLLGAVFGVVGALFARPVVRLFGATPEIEEPAIAYLTIVAVGFPFMMLGLVLNSLFRAAGNTLTPMLILTSAAFINAGLAPLFIYGLGPFPRLEVRGAALATIIAQISTAVIAMLYLRNGRTAYTLHLRDFRLSLPIVRDIAQVGAPATADTLLRSIVASVFNRILGTYGPAAIAAHGLSLRVLMVVISVLGGGVNQALVPIVGFNFGALNYRRMWHAYQIAAVWTSGGGLLLGGLMCLFAKEVLSPFAKDPELLRLGVLALRLKMCTFFLIEPQMMAVFTLQGMGMGGRAMVLTMCRNVVFVLPAVFVLPHLFGVVGAFSAQAVADVGALFVAAGVMWKVYRMYLPDTPGLAGAEPSPASVVAGE